MIERVEESIVGKGNVVRTRRAETESVYNIYLSWISQAQKNPLNTSMWSR